jgi:hypothetical protein
LIQHCCHFYSHYLGKIIIFCNRKQVRMEHISLFGMEKFRRLGGSLGG